MNEALCFTGAAAVPLSSQSGLTGSCSRSGTAEAAGARCIIFSLDQPRNLSDPSVWEEKGREGAEVTGNKLLSRTSE